MTAVTHVTVAETTVGRAWQPGRIYFGVLTLVLLVHAYLGSYPGGNFDVIFILPIDLALGIIWLVSLVNAFARGRNRTAVRLRRWVAPGIAVGLVFVFMWSGWAMRVGFALSRPAFESALSATSISGVNGSRWIGIYPVDFTEQTASGAVKFFVHGACFIDDCGFVWTNSGTTDLDCEAPRLREPIDGPWYAFECGW